MSVKIGCVGLVRGGSPRQVLAIECKKGRGLILPAGKWEKKDPTFRDCAAREVWEETGVHILAREGRLIHSGLACDGYFNYIFEWDSPKDTYNMRETEEGIPRWVDYHDLLNQECIFLPDYDILFDGAL